MEGRRHVLNLASTLVAAEQCQIRCRTHKWCNATCADPQPAVEYTPLLSPGPLFSIQPPPSVSFPETAVTSASITIAVLEPFAYDPLPPEPGFIRLVRILPAVFLADPITIELVHIRHSEELKYAALQVVQLEQSHGKEPGSRRVVSSRAASRLRRGSRERVRSRRAGLDYQRWACV